MLCWIWPEKGINVCGKSKIYLQKMENISSGSNYWTFLTLFLLASGPVSVWPISTCPIQSIPDKDLFETSGIWTTVCKLEFPDGTAWTEADTIPFFQKQSRVGHHIEPISGSELLPDHHAYRTPYDCQVLFDGSDPTTGDRKKELAFEMLFTYTASHIKPYLPGQDVLETQCKLIRFKGGYTYVTVQFQWNANDPQSVYGRLKSNSAIRLYLTDNKSVTLFNNQDSNWHYNPQSGTYFLQATFLLHPRQIKLLKKEAVLRTTVYWERGFEEYSVYALTLFRDQLNCLE